MVVVSGYALRANPTYAANEIVDTVIPVKRRARPDQIFFPT